MRQSPPPKKKYTILVVLILIFHSTNFFAQYSPTGPDKELAIQIQYGATVTAELTNITNAYSYQANNCDELLVYTASNPDTSISEINGPYFELKKGFTIEDYGVTEPDEMRHSLNLVKFKSGGSYIEYSEGVALYFIYDTRDCNYYSSCPSHRTKDVTIRLTNYNSNSDFQVWFYNDHTTDESAPSESNGWINVSQSTYNCWNAMGYTHCDLNWENLAPTTPQNFQLSGSVGQHPTLTWQMNREPDLNGYKIYRGENGQSYNYLQSIGANSTSYTDYEVTVGNSKNDPTVCYKISAYDTDNSESQLTNSKCTKASAINKNAAEGFLEFEYNLSNPYPNPFNPSTNINYSIKKAGEVKIILYDLLGKTVSILVDDYVNKGNYSFLLDVTLLSSGIYFYKMSVNNFSAIKKLQVIK